MNKHSPNHILKLLFYLFSLFLLHIFYTIYSLSLTLLHLYCFTEKGYIKSFTIEFIIATNILDWGVDWLGNSRATQALLFWSHQFVAFALCLGLLSRWKINPPNHSSLTKTSTLFPAFTFPVPSQPVKAAQKHHRITVCNVMLASLKQQ